MLHMLAAARRALLFAFLPGVVVAQTPGSFFATGQGCPGASVLYERFAVGGFDLVAGGSLDFVPNGLGGYLLTRGANGLLPHAGGSVVALQDDDVSAPQSLGFAFPYPSGLGLTNAIEISSNGYVYLEPGTIASTRCCDAGGAAFRSFLDDTPSWAVLGTDLDPQVAGTVWLNSGAAGAWVTFDQVPDAQGASVNTFQIQFYPDGRVSLVWTLVGSLARTALVGWSGGGGLQDPGSFDFSAHPAFDMGASFGPLTIGAPLARIPTIGSTFVIDITTIPPAGTVGSLLTGLARQDIALDVFGMPGCTLYVNSSLPAFPLALRPPTGSLSIPLPNDPGLVGFTLETQAAVVAPGVNTLSIAASNRGSITIGDSTPVIVRAQGADSENDDDRDGFWKVINATNLSIVAVRFDFARSVPANRLYFDTNQTGMADRFDGGNSTTPLCRGTYRNASDVVTGLDYTLSGASPCGGTARTGWIGTNFFGGAGSVRTLDFRFTGFDPGEVFEFDCDVDGGGPAGGDMAGMVATVIFTNGTSRSGPLVRLDANTAQVGL